MTTCGFAVRLMRKIERSSVDGEDLASFRAKPPYQGGAYHAFMPGDVDTLGREIEWQSG
jgi:hypothetical protein